MRATFRTVLLWHIDGHRVPFIINNSPVSTTVRALISRGWIRTEPHVPRPRWTEITDAGRMALAKALAEWADALVAYQARSTDGLLLRFLSPETIENLNELGLASGSDRSHSDPAPGDFPRRKETQDA